MSQKGCLNVRVMRRGADACMHPDRHFPKGVPAIRFDER